ncbi:MAG: glutamate-1-semialdehyde 2,1-aminomutase [Nitrospirota bacterium]
MKWFKSKTLYSRAKRYIPGGVNSPVRAFRSVGGYPIFIKNASGSRVYDIDGNEYIDYVLSWGPMILGHSYPKVVNALKRAVEKGTSYGAPTELEIELARIIISAFPSIKMVRMVNSGTEATMSAIRVARAYTGRDKIIKFEGCYHGHSDGLLVKAGSGATTFGVPDSPGVPRDYARNTINLPFNNIKALRKTLNRVGRDVACVIIEPVVGNMGCILPKDGFLQELRAVTKKYGIIFIFDEVMTGFRVAYGGAQELYGINPDMTCLGKIIGGGLPVGAYGGRKDIMMQISPEGPVYQAGTLSGNPLAMTAGIETLKTLSKSGIYEKLEKRAEQLEDGINEAAKRAGVKIYFSRVGSMFCTYFTDREVWDYNSAKMSDTKRFSKFFRSMLSKGINLAPSQFEAGFLSTAHTFSDIENTIKAVRESFRTL